MSENKKPDIAAIMPGTRREIVERIGWEDYVSLPAMNPSTLVAGIRETDKEGGVVVSMLHVKDAWEQPSKDSPSKSWGRAVHTAMLEPDKFEERYVTWDGDRRGNAWKEFAADAYLSGKEVIKSDEVEGIVVAACRGSTCPVLTPYLKHGKVELTVFDVEFDVQYRGRLDWVSADTNTIVDVKTTKNVSPSAFGRDFFAYHYDIKLGLYRRWLSRLHGAKWNVVVAAIENTPPYDVVVYDIPDAVLDQGVDRALRVMERLPAAIKRDSWPGVSRGAAMSLVVPYHQQVHEDMVEWVDE